MVRNAKFSFGPTAYVGRRVISNLQKQTEEGEGEKKSLHQLRKEREADREEKIQVAILREPNIIFDQTNLGNFLK